MEICQQCFELIDNCTCVLTEIIISASPVAQFFALIYEIFMMLPSAIQALIGMVLGTAVFFGIITMIRS